MPIVFSDQDKQTITRRILNIQLEDQAYNMSLNTFSQQAALLLQVDQSNSKFYEFYDTQVRAYEGETADINGQVADEYMDSDVQFAGQFGIGGIFYPNTSSPIYLNNIPLISSGLLTNNTVRGAFFPTSTNALYELNLMSNPSNVHQYGINDLINIMENGITAGASGSQTTTGTIAAGPVVGATLIAPNSTNFTINELVYLNSGAASGIYYITAITVVGITKQFTLDSVLPTLSGLTNPTIVNTASGFNNAQRETLSGGAYNEILNNLATSIISQVNQWIVFLNDQLVKLALQNDARTIQHTENLTAISNANSAITTLNTWLALPNTIVANDAKFADQIVIISPPSTHPNLIYITGLISTRQLYLPNRITEILTALGTTGPNALSQIGDTFTSTDMTNSYFQRYEWLNIRINRISGSLRRHYLSLSSSGSINTLLANNEMVLDQYDQYFLVKKITFVDPNSNILQVTDNMGFSIGDQVYVTSNTQPIIPRTVQAILGTNQIQIDSVIPVTYSVFDQARVFKQLQ